MDQELVYFPKQHNSRNSYSCLECYIDSFNEDCTLNLKVAHIKSNIILKGIKQNEVELGPYKQIKSVDLSRKHINIDDYYSSYNNESTTHRFDGMSYWDEAFDQIDFSPTVLVEETPIQDDDRYQNINYILDKFIPAKEQDIFRLFYYHKISQYVIGTIFKINQCNVSFACHRVSDIVQTYMSLPKISQEDWGSYKDYIESLSFLHTNKKRIMDYVIYYLQGFSQYQIIKFTGGSQSGICTILRILINRLPNHPISKLLKFRRDNKTKLFYSPKLYLLK